MVEKTTIQITKETRAALEAIGKKGESYNTIIQRLLRKSEGGRIAKK